MCVCGVMIKLLNISFCVSLCVCVLWHITERYSGVLLNVQFDANLHVLPHCVIFVSWQCV